ncbi:MAG: F0F1 ATP synthase subunit B [Anaerolineales bacterium]|nr:F0F1 ATP synthase subunit B [Anaerolineales bacterium]
MEALGISPFGIVAYIVNFIILVVLLQMFLYKPVTQMLAQRQQRIADGLSAADRAAREAALQRAEFEKELAKAREASQAEARKAAEATEKMRQDIIAAAQKEAEEIKARARAEAEQEKQQVATDLQKEAASLAMQITRKVVGGAIDENAQRTLVNQFLANLGDGK